MSNSSDPNLDGLRLLAGVARECARLGSQIEDLGQTLTEGKFGPVEGWVAQLQQFDRLCQHAHSQARLVTHLVRCLRGVRPMAQEELRDLIADVPLPDVRERLADAVGLQMQTASAIDNEMWGDDFAAGRP